MKTFLQRDHSGSRNCSMGSIIIDYLLIVNVQDTAIVRTGLESIDPIFGNIYQSRKDIEHRVRGDLPDGHGLHAGVRGAAAARRHPRGQHLRRHPRHAHDVDYDYFCFCYAS